MRRCIEEKCTSSSNSLREIVIELMHHLSPLFGFMVSEDDVLKLAHIGFESLWPSRKPHLPGIMRFNATSHVQDSLGIPQCFPACAKITPGMDVPP